MTTMTIDQFRDHNLVKLHSRKHDIPVILATAFLLLAAVVLVTSYGLPYWSITLRAPQYPHGLTVHAYLTHLNGDLHEIDGLNHYIGMKPLEQGGQFERSTAPLLIITLGLLLASAMFVRNRWAAILAGPAMLFPLLFLVDLQAWLYYFGHHLDKHAALSSSIKSFTPRVLGVGMVGQFKTVASVEPGFIWALASVGCIVIGLFFHRMAYKPLVDARKRLARGGQS